MFMLAGAGLHIRVAASGALIAVCAALVDVRPGLRVRVTSAYDRRHRIGDTVQAFWFVYLRVCASTHFITAMY